MTSVAQCSVAICDKPERSRGYCTGHYQRLCKGLPVDVPLRERNLKFCIIPGCSSKTKARNRCNRHYEELRSFESEPCILDRCERPSSFTGLCTRHYPLLKRYTISVSWLKEQWLHGCDICGRTDQPLHVDHDHSCCDRDDAPCRSCGYCVRGVLCSSCNWGLGKFRDDETILSRAISYLSRTRASVSDKLK